jgi:hypothetical protein
MTATARFLQRLVRVSYYFTLLGTLLLNGVSAYNNSNISAWDSHLRHHVGKHHHFHADVRATTELYVEACRAIEGCTWKATTSTVPPSYELISHLLDQYDNFTFLALEFDSATLSGNSVVQLDRAFAERPWWWINTEILTETRFLLVARHTPLELTTYFRAITQRMYPSQARCSNTLLEVSNHHGDTWGIRWTQAYESADAIDASTIYHILVRNVEDGNDRPVYFSGTEDCTAYYNKWECLFLTTTNCTLPKQLLDCRTRRSCFSDNLITFSNASAEGVFVTNDGGKIKESLAAIPPEKRFPKPPTVRMGAFHVYHPLQLPNLISRESTEVQDRNTYQLLDNYLYYLGVATRFNSFFRMRVHSIVSRFRHSFDPPFLENSTCIALHIRQDDRNVPGVEDLDIWCNSCSVMNPEGRRHGYKDGCTLYDRTDWYDKGCASRLPFGKASIIHFLNSSAALLPAVTNIFIMTDDIDWLHDQKQKHVGVLDQLHREKGIRLLPYPVRPKHRRMELVGAEDFWASVTLAQQCKGFVGHFGSAATQIIYRSLCYYSDHSFMRCPDIYDIGGVF